jgi:hypothetical protein
MCGEGAQQKDIGSYLVALIVTPNTFHVSWGVILRGTMERPELVRTPRCSSGLIGYQETLSDDFVTFFRWEKFLMTWLRKMDWEKEAEEAENE